MRFSIAKFCFLNCRASRLILLATAFSLSQAVSIAQGVGGASTANDVVAVVNADPITRSMLSEATVRRFGGEILENMVNRFLILQECNERGIEVTKQEVSDEIRRLAGKFGLSMESYLNLLQENRQITASQYSREIIWPMLSLRKLVSDQVQVTSEEFNQAYLAQFGEAVKCRLIMVEDRAKALQLHQQAAANPDQFSQLAKQYSEDEASASVGGLIPPIRRYTGDSRLEDAAFALSNGQVSSVLQLGDQWIFLQAVRRIPASTPSPQSLPAIKEQINDRIRDEKVRAAAGELFAKLQQKSKVINVLGDASLEQQHPGVAAIVNGEEVLISQVGAEAMKRHGSDVLEGEVNRKLLLQSLRSEKLTVTQDDLDREIAAGAVAAGYVSADGAADLGAWFDSITADGSTTVDVYVQDVVWPSAALKKLVEGSIEVTQVDLENGFESAYGPRVEVLAVVLSDQRTAQKVWEMARDNPTDAFFGGLAEQYSVEPVSSSNQGKVPPIRKHGGQPAVEKEAFSLQPGELSGIIATGGKYLVLRCQGYTEPVVSDPSIVQAELLRDLSDRKTKQAMAAKFEQLVGDAEIDNFFEQDAAPRVAARPDSQ
ncbi:MAG: peptidylprolyl isomerase [Rubripirellula sp.]